MGPVAVGKSTLFIEKVTEEDIDTYRLYFVQDVQIGQTTCIMHPEQHVLSIVL